MIEDFYQLNNEFSKAYDEKNYDLIDKLKVEKRDLKIEFLRKQLQYHNTKQIKQYNKRNYNWQWTCKRIGRYLCIRM